MILKKLWMILGLYCNGCKRWHTARVPTDSSRIYCYCGASWNVGWSAVKTGTDFKKKIKLIRRKVLHVYDRNKKVSDRFKVSSKN